MWLDGKPTRVNATPDSVKKDYEILKENLPIPMGIDHLKDKTLQENPILKKMNLLNVGVIKDVELIDDEIRITEAEITNPTIKQLHEAGELPGFSKVSDMYTANATVAGADVDEMYSVINRVDFVEKQACEQCRVKKPGHGDACFSRATAKAIIGDDRLPEDTSNPGNQGSGAGEGEEDESNVSLADVLKEIKSQNEYLRGAITRIEGNLGIAAPTPEGATASGSGEGEEEGEGGEGQTGQASEADSAVIELQKDMAAMKANAAKAEATGIVKGYLAEGKIKPADTDKHIAMAMKAPEDYKAIMDNAEVIIDMNRQSEHGEGNAGDSTEGFDYKKAKEEAGLT